MACAKRWSGVCWKDLKYLVIIYFFIYQFLVYKIHLQKNHRLHSTLESSRLHSNLESPWLHSTTPVHLLHMPVQIVKFWFSLRMEVVYKLIKLNRNIFFSRLSRIRSILTYFCYGRCCLAILKMKIFSNFLIGE
jgi:hypothetical protein